MAAVICESGDKGQSETDTWGGDQREKTLQKVWVKCQSGVLTVRRAFRSDSDAVWTSEQQEDEKTSVINIYSGNRQEPFWICDCVFVTRIITERGEGQRKCSRVIQCVCVCVSWLRVLSDCAFKLRKTDEQNQEQLLFYLVLQNSSFTYFQLHNSRVPFRQDEWLVASPALISDFSPIQGT